jgi:hypothetical protein
MVVGLQNIETFFKNVEQQHGSYMMKSLFSYQFDDINTIGARNMKFCMMLGHKYTYKLCMKAFFIC